MFELRLSPQTPSAQLAGLGFPKSLPLVFEQPNMECLCWLPLIQQLSDSFLSTVWNQIMSQQFTGDLSRFLSEIICLTRTFCAMVCHDILYKIISGRIPDKTLPSAQLNSLDSCRFGCLEPDEDDPHAVVCLMSHRAVSRILTGGPQSTGVSDEN